MKIVQEPTYRPIVIKLETREEAQAFWELVDENHTRLRKGSLARDLAIKISNWFTNNF